MMFEKGHPVRAIEINAYTEFVSRTEAVIPELGFGEKVVVDKRFSGGVTAVNAEGTFDVEIT
jgi:hypothetical protein